MPGHLSFTAAGLGARKQLQLNASDAVVQSGGSNRAANNRVTPRDCAKEK
jgi:hypothetical protein